MRPLMESFFRWVRVARASATGRTLATKTLGYAANQEFEFLRVLDDAKLPLDSTRSERAAQDRDRAQGLDVYVDSTLANAFDTPQERHKQSTQNNGTAGKRRKNSDPPSNDEVFAMSIRDATAATVVGWVYIALDQRKKKSL